MTTRLVGISPLMKALFARLSTHALTSTYRIFNYIAINNPALPYVVIGGPLYGRSESFYTRDDAAEDIVLHVHIWSNTWQTEVEDMMNNISSAVTSSALAPTGYTVMLGQNDFAQIMIDDTDPNRLLRHGVIRFRFQMA